MVTVLEGDCREVLPTLAAESMQCVTTSPPYWGLRDYGVSGQIGLESTPEEYVRTMVGVFRAVRRVLRGDGTCWVNMGDGYFGPAGGYDPKYEPDDDDPKSFGGTKACTVRVNQRQKRAAPAAHATLKTKDLIGMPWRLAFALQADGWYLRSDIIWAKANPMPESVTDRPTKAHEYVFLLTKSARYFYDQEAVRERWADERCGEPGRPSPKALEIPGQSAHTLGRVAWTNGGATGRNLRSVWTIPSEPTPEAHFATFPRKLVAPCILAGTSAKGACVACGAPWRREVKRTPEVGTPPGGHKRWQNVVNGGPGASTLSTVARYEVTTTGWRPTCDHDAPVVPCTVLDPFGGTGTVGRVAEDLGRDSVLIELNGAYVEMLKQKTAQQGLFSSRGVGTCR